MSTVKSRLLLYLVLLPGFALPSAVMLWFPDAYTSAFSFIQANPPVMLLIAIVTCGALWYPAAAGMPESFRARFRIFMFVTATAGLVYVSVNFNSFAIAYAMVAGGIVVQVVAMAIKDYSARKRDT